MQQRDEDELWLEIVANYGERVLDDADLNGADPQEERPDEAEYDDRPPVDPDVPSARESPPERGRPTDKEAHSDHSAPADRDAAADREEAEPERRDPPPDLFAVWADEGRFVPPPPPKVPIPETPRLLAWLGIFGAPAILLITVVLGIYLPQLLRFGLLAWFVGGFGYLVMSMPQEPRDPGDDGARI